MIEAHLSMFDAIVLGVLLTSCLFAFFRGFVREILSLGAWVGAALITLYYFPDVAEKLQPHFKNPVVAAGIATLGLYIGALICFSVVNMFIFKLLKSGEEIGPTDNLLGLAFGALRGAFIIAVGYFFLAVAIPTKDRPDWLEKSITRPYAEEGAKLLMQIAPNYLRDLVNFDEEPDAEEATTDKKKPWRRKESNDTNSAPGYKRNKLDNLIDETTAEEE